MTAIRVPLRYRFPEPAGSYQAAGEAARLLRELGDNYLRYHEALADEVEAIGSRLPDPRAYEGRVDDWARAAAYRQELVAAEALLRDCALARRAPGVARGRPLVDERHRLVSAHADAETRGRRRGSEATARWTPPEAPAGFPL
jgi:hypothetical protein